MNKQRWIVIGSMSLLLAAACVLNYRLSLPEETQPDAQAMAQEAPTDQAAQETVSAGNLSANTDFFAQYKTDRDAKRADEITYLDSILSDASADDATRKQAQQLKLEAASSLEKELTVETLLKAKGFEDSAVVFHEGAVNVIIGKKELTQAEVASILDIVIQETQQGPENIKIIPVE